MHVEAGLHGRRVTVYQLRGVLTRGAHDAGLPPTTPHQLPDAYRALDAITSGTGLTGPAARDRGAFSIPGDP